MCDKLCFLLFVVRLAFCKLKRNIREINDGGDSNDNIDTDISIDFNNDFNNDNDNDNNDTRNGILHEDKLPATKRVRKCFLSSILTCVA